MTNGTVEKDAPETFWRRWLRRITAFEEAMDMTYDDCQDRRMDSIEAELVRLRIQLGSPPTAS